MHQPPNIAPSTTLSLVVLGDFVRGIRLGNGSLIKAMVSGPGVGFGLRSWAGGALWSRELISTKPFAISRHRISRIDREILAHIP